MKKRILSFVFALISVLFCFSGCSKTNKTEPSAPSDIESATVTDQESLPVPVIPEDRFLSAGYGGYFFNNVFYYYDFTKSTLCYQNLNNVQKQPLPVYNNFLAEASENPFANGSGRILLVDEQATAKNNGLPVLIVVSEKIFTETIDNKPVRKEINRLVSYNTGTGKMTVITDELGESIYSFYLYGDTIYFIQFEGEEVGYVHYTVNKNGGTPKKMDFPEAGRSSLLGVVDGKLYSFAWDYGRLYRSDLNYENRELLLEDLPSVKMPPCIFNGYLYYTGQTEVDEVFEKEFAVVDVLRKPLTDLSGEGELIAEKVYVASWGVNGEQIFYYSTAYAVFERNDVNYLKKLLVFDTRSGKTNTVYDLSENPLQTKSLHTMSDDWLVCKVTDYTESGELVKQYKTLTNLKTGEEIDFPFKF
ncbi:MAG: hypothetical protein IJZ33_07785 [Clostridia bacterium]|nr:hypothetical protein [Clostridia bacterium]